MIGLKIVRNVQNVNRQERIVMFGMGVFVQYVEKSEMNSILGIKIAKNVLFVEKQGARHINGMGVYVPFVVQLETKSIVGMGVYVLNVEKFGVGYIIGTRMNAQNVDVSE